MKESFDSANLKQCKDNEDAGEEEEEEEARGEEEGKQRWVYIEKWNRCVCCNFPFFFW